MQASNTSLVSALFFIADGFLTIRAKHRGCFVGNKRRKWDSKSEKAGEIVDKRVTFGSL